MSREIKFRAWWPSQKRMFLPVSGCDLLIRIDGKKFVQMDVAENTGLDPAFDEIVFEQFTGLKDKNGKEIYEGDILDQTVNGKKIVTWNENRCAFNVFPSRRSTTYPYTIIGNIHENPDLLKV